MPVGYSPRSFFAVAFSREGNTTWLLALPRSLLLLPASIALAVLDHYQVLGPLGELQLTVLITPFTLLLGLVTAFRLNDSFKKWDRAGQLTLELHQKTRTVCSRLCSFLPADDPAVVESVLEIRRLVLLGCVLIKQHVRNERDLDGLVQCGLLMDSEKQRLSQTVTLADGPTGDGKKDKYPSKSRPNFAFQEASTLNHNLMRAKHFSCPHTFWGIETSLSALSDILEDSEHLAISLLPLPYAQLTRVLALLYLLVLPIAFQPSLGWLSVPLCFVSNLTYFLIDECSGQMEEPFGQDPNDVALEKTLRRIDKLTAAQLCQYVWHTRLAQCGRPAGSHGLPPAWNTSKLRRPVPHDTHNTRLKVTHPLDPQRLRRYACERLRCTSPGLARSLTSPCVATHFAASGTSTGRFPISTCSPTSAPPTQRANVPARSV